MSKIDFANLTDNSKIKADSIFNEMALIDYAKQFITYKSNKILLLIGLIKSKVSIDFIKNFLQMSESEIQDAINKDILDITVLNDNNGKSYDPTRSRKKSSDEQNNDWSLHNLQILTGLWLLQAPTNLICHILKKNPSNIYYRRKKLGLPTRRKLKTNFELNEDVLTWEEANMLKSSVKYNKTWPIRNSDRNCYISTNDQGTINWGNQELIKELSNRWWANQHPDDIAKDFATSPSAIKSMAHWISLPKRDRSKLISEYKPETAKENSEKA